MRLVNNKTLQTEVVVNDLINVRKVAAKRIDAAFIDLNNLSYYLKYDAKNLADQVQANPRVIGTKDLVIAINDKFSDKTVNATVSRGLSKIDPDKIIRDYMDRNF